MSQNHNHKKITYGQCSCGQKDCKSNKKIQPYKIAEDNNITDDNKILLDIIGLDCASCANEVEEELNKMKEVKKVSLVFATSTLIVVPSKDIPLDDLINRLQKVTDSVEDGVTIKKRTSSNKIEKPKLINIKEDWNLLLGVIFYVISIVISLKAPSMALIPFILTYLLIGYKILLTAGKNILKGKIFDENFLMCVATLGAFAISDYSEAIAVLLFYSIGELFQSYSVNKTRNSISNLMDIKSDYANLKSDNGIKQVDPASINIGDIIVVKVGEKIPLDGVIVSGSTSLNTSALTGESKHPKVKEGDTVLSGTINVSNVIEVEVNEKYENSTVAKIIDMIENAASQKAPVESFITKFAKVYTPIVCGLALLLAIVPMLILKDAVFYDWVYRALTFLVVSCPCALVVSIPLGLYAGIGKAGKIGALIKGSNYLELLKDVDTIMFDKTGTLTDGFLSVTSIDGDNDTLMYAAYGEYYSTHPISKCIINKYSNDIEESKITEYKEIPGKGISYHFEDKNVLIGNQKLMDENNIKVTHPTEVGTIIYVSVDNTYMGTIIISDNIKESSKAGISLLKELNINNVIMVTGDHKNIADKISSELGINVTYSELLPNEKVEKLQDEKKKNHKVAFVGDGINDAPVLTMADVGIAMGGIGSDSAVEAADMVLMNDDISIVAKSIEISKKTNKILKENIVFTILIKVIILALTMFGLSNMWMGVFADVGVTLIAILNSMRILK